MRKVRVARGARRMQHAQPMLKAVCMPRWSSSLPSEVVLPRWSEVVRKPASGHGLKKLNGSRSTSASMSVMTTSRPHVIDL